MPRSTKVNDSDDPLRLIEGGKSDEEPIVTVGKPLEEKDDGSLEGVSVPAIFSAFLPKKNIPFRIGDCAKESSATMRKMNGDKIMKFQEMLSGVSETNMVGFSDVIQFILLHSVLGMDLFYDKENSDGTTQLQQYPFPDKDEKQREAFFRELEPDLRQRLFKEAMKVNGFSPS